MCVCVCVCHFLKSLSRPPTPSPTPPPNPFYTFTVVCAAEAGEMEDLTHLVGPLTEESTVRCLQARFHNSHYEVRVRHSLLSQTISAGLQLIVIRLLRV